MICCSAKGAEPAWPNTGDPWSLAHYQHTSFTKKEGAPFPDKVVETADGYLWADNGKGVSRFDGQRFQPFEPFPGEALGGKDANNLFAPKAGGLWMAHASGGASFIKNGHVSVYGKEQGFDSILAALFFEDRRGDVIAYTAPGFMKFSGGKWVKFIAEDDSERGYVARDADFNVWKVTKTGRLHVLRENTRKFVDTGVDVSGALMVWPGPDHTIFVGFGTAKIKRFEDNNGTVSEVGRPLPFLGLRVLVDSNKLVWVSTANDGVHFLGALDKLPRDDAPLPVDEKLNHANGLTGNFSYVYEDSHGTIWVATDGGIDRFMPSPFSQVALPFGTMMATLQPNAMDDVWLGSENLPVRRLTQHASVETSVPPAALMMYRDDANAVFAVTSKQLWQLEPGPPKVIADLPVTGTGRVLSMTHRPDGEFWLAFRPKKFGLTRLREGQWLPIDGFPAISALFTDKQGVTWAGNKNLLTAFEQNQPRTYSAKDGLAAGVIKVIVANDGTLWIGGDENLQMFDGRTFTSLTLAGGRKISEVSGLVFDNGGNLWVQAIDGIFRVEREEVRKAVAAHSYTPRYRFFDSLDGVPGEPAQIFSLPTMRRGAGGRLWISGQTSAAWINTLVLPKPLPLRTPIVEQLFDGTTSYDLNVQTVALPKTARDLQFAYTTPELRFPERLRFQYRLRGLDDTWQDAGTERKATYHALSAGDYRFEVRSRNKDDDEWNGPVASLAFVIAPKYYETLWFKALEAAAALLVLWAVIRVQVRIGMYRERNKMRIRANEREAVARDLHDTLLQSNQAVVLQLAAMANRLDDPVLKGQLTALAELSQDVAAEGRDKVQALRVETDDASDELKRIVELGNRLSAEHQVAFDARVNGQRRQLRKDAGAELVAIVNELMINAFRHAKGSKVDVGFDFGRRRLEVLVADDGIGISSATLAIGSPAGHWGLQGVRERAAAIQAEIAFEQASPKGTKIRIAIPARRIYAE
ncbi:sensor histidine kinase [Duganella aquatilis]|nr:sensor histidine kinase [Duganella aquatilis]